MALKHLSHYAKHNSHLFFMRWIRFQQRAENIGAIVRKVHQFLYRIDFNQKKIYIKVNNLDQKFYIFQKQKPLLYFSSFEELRNWLLYIWMERETNEEK
jgi:hypothetical protein